MPEITPVTHLSFWVATLVAGIVGVFIGIVLTIPYARMKAAHVEQLKGQIIAFEDRCNKYVSTIIILRIKQIQLLDSQCILFASLAKQLGTVYRLGNDVIVTLPDGRLMWEFPDKLSHLLIAIPKYSGEPIEPDIEVVFSRASYDLLVQTHPTT